MTNPEAASSTDAAPDAVEQGSGDSALPNAVAETVATTRPPRSRVPLIVGLVVLSALLAAGGILVGVITAQRSPQAAAERFLTALVESDPDAVVAALVGRPGGQTTLIGEGTAPTDGVTAFQVVSSSVEGAEATVVAEVTLAGETNTVEIPLQLVRRDLGVFDVWRVDSTILPTVSITYARPDGMDLTVNGGTLAAFDGPSESGVPALPGTYVFEPTGGTDLYAADPVTVTVGFGDRGTAALPVHLTDAGRSAAQAAVNAALDACVGQPTFAPVGNCGFQALDDGAGATYTNIRWEILVRPTVTFGDYTDHGGWAVSPASGGTLRMTADYDLPGEYGTGEATVDNVEQAGWITGFDADGIAAFESVEYR